MLFKRRKESILLKCYRILNTRMELTCEEKMYYLSQEKGWEGEVKFDLLTEKLSSDCYILNDLLLEINNSSFQIDTILIYGDAIFLIDVKNIEGDFCYDNDKFQTIKGKEFKNPLIQLKKSTSLFRQLLQYHQFNLNIEDYVVFINPEFTLYQAPLNLPTILPTQLNRFMKKLDMKLSRLNQHHKKLAEKLVSLHQTHSPYTKLPSYEYLGLKKGITCQRCSSFSVSVSGKKVICGDCENIEVIESAVMRCVEEIKLLFPDLKITTNLVQEWCGVVESKKRISRILKRNLIIKGFGQWTYFE